MVISRFIFGQKGQDSLLLVGRHLFFGQMGDFTCLLTKNIMFFIYAVAT